MIKQCEIELVGCEITENLRSYAGMIMCQTCYDKEMIAQAELKAGASQRIADSNEAVRVNAVNKALIASQKIDSSVQIRTDLFNAATVSIDELKKAIDEDTTIVNKPYALAEELTNRLQHFQKVAFEAQETVVAANNNQRAIQTYLNTFANTLRAEEREKLKIQDINYKPTAVKPVKPAAIKKKKVDKAELRKYAMELGISEFTLTMLVVGGLTIEQAANKLRKSIKEAQSEAAPIQKSEPEPIEVPMDVIDSTTEE